MNNENTIELYIGMPVHIIWDGKPNTNWVGYIRRLDFKQKLAEVGPETIVGSHLRVYDFERLVPTKFTDDIHRNLLAEIERLKNDPTNIIK